MVAACSSKAPLDNADDVRCEILLDYAENWFAGTAPKTKHLSSTPEPLRYSELQIEAAQEAVKKGAPNAASDLIILRDRVRLADKNPVAECQDLRRLRKAKSYEPKASEIGKTVDAEGFFYGYETLTLSMPGVDLEEGRAGFDASHVCGPLCAGGSFVKYRRKGSGEWVLENEEGTWIS